MLYSNYLRDKSQNAIKIEEVEGNPCIIENSKGRNLKDYKIYGNSYQATRSGRNLLPYPYSRTTTTTNGVTFTDNGDGSVTVNGTATANATWYFYSDTKNLINGLKIGDTVTVSIDCDKTWVQSPATMNIVCNYYNSETTMKDGGCVVNSTTKYKTITIGDDWVGIGMYIVVYSGQTINNITLRPQVELGSTATEYEQYGVSPSPDYQSEVQSVGDLVESGEYAGKYAIPVVNRGKNLVELPEFYNASGISVNYQDEIYHIVPNENGTANVVSLKNTLNLKAGETVTISCKINHKGNRVNGLRVYSIDLQYTSITYVGSTGKGSTVVPSTELTKYSYTYTASKDMTLYFQIYVHGFIDEDGDGTSDRHPIDFSDFQIEYGTVATEYEPYRGIETTHIYLNEPLRKVGDYADYIDFKNQKVIRNVFKQLLNTTAIYKKLNSVIRVACRNISMRQKYDTHMLSTIFNYNYDWFANTECIFHHNATNYNYYWSIYWNRLGLTYDGTNVYRTDDTSQTPLTDSEIISIANEWLSTLSDKDKEIYMILDTPTEEPVSLPALKTVKGTTIMSVDTSIQPTNIKAKYIKL